MEREDSGMDGLNCTSCRHSMLHASVWACPNLPLLDVDNMEEGLRVAAQQVPLTRMWPRQTVVSSSSRELHVAVVQSEAG